MLIYLLLILFTIVAFELFLQLRIGTDARVLCKVAQDSMRVLILSGVTDEEKELSLRRMSAEILRLTWRFALKFFSIVLTLYLLFILITTPLPHLRRAILETAVSPVALALLTIAVLCYGSVRKAILAR